MSDLTREQIEQCTYPIGDCVCRAAEPSCKDGGHCGVGGYCDDCPQEIPLYTRPDDGLVEELLAQAKCERDSSEMYGSEALADLLERAARALGEIGRAHV